MKKSFIVALSIILIFLFSLPAIAASAKTIGDVNCVDRIGPRDDIIKVIRIDDPQNPFVSIYMTQVKSGKVFAITDPSNCSISCRLTGEIPVSNGKLLINKSVNKDIGHFRKSIGTKIMKIARWYDSERNVLIYVVYTTKLLGGSVKHSMSVVPLGKINEF